MLSGLPYVHGNITLNNKIDQVNLASAHVCRDTANCVFLGNEKAQLRPDRIHFTLKSKDLVARTVAHHVKQCLKCVA